MKDAIEVPFRFDSEAEPNSCFLSVESLVARRGGELVTGWLVQEEPFWWEGVHHACWRDAQGVLWNTTPQLNVRTFDPMTGVGIAVGRSIRFLVDPAATLQGEKPNRRVLPNRYVPKVDNKHLREGCSHLAVSNVHYYGGDHEKGNYYTRRAEQCFRRAGVRVTVDPLPLGLTFVNAGF